MNIIVFAGTTEGRDFIRALNNAGVDHIACVATEYGKKLLEGLNHSKVLDKRLNGEEMKALFKEKSITHCVDATHPFALIVSENIKSACEECGVNYIRVARDLGEGAGDSIRFFKDHDSCARALLEESGNIMLTTGSKDLSTYCRDESLRSRIFARVLAAKESLNLCEEAGLFGKQIIAMQGPFSQDLNEALMKSFDIKVMVTKQSGKTGGFYEKQSACENLGVKLFVVGLPMEDEGLGVSGALEKLGIKDEKITDMALIGVGMGNSLDMTIEAMEFIKKADVIFGAQRLIEDYNPRFFKKPVYLSKDIMESLKTEVPTGSKVAVLFSGDSGFNSGATKLSKALDDEISRGASIKYRIIPGISSISFFASRIHKSYDDACIFSIHGKGENQYKKLVETAKSNKKTFSILSGKEDLIRLSKDLKDLKLYFGRNLSYPDEVVGEYDNGLVEKLHEGLFVVYIENENPDAPGVSGYISDEDFIRDKVPMTKSAIRSLSISRLALRADSILYDIGAGTGSVSVEAALLSRDLQVFAIERKPEAVSLINKNAEKFGAENIEVIPAYAPEGIMELPAPTHAFIGGSGGNLLEILRVLKEKNPHCRVVINAVSLETLTEIMEMEKLFNPSVFNLMQINAVNTKKTGSYTMLNSENPVFICEMEF